MRSGGAVDDHELNVTQLIPIQSHDWDALWDSTVPITEDELNARSPRRIQIGFYSPALLII